MKLMGEGMMIAWAQLGIVLVNEKETQERLTLYISVPAHSYRVDANGMEMSGEHLAKRFKDTLIDIGIKRLTVKMKIRDEYWTKEMADEADLNTRKMLFGSQY